MRSGRAHGIGFGQIRQRRWIVWPEGHLDAVATQHLQTMDAVDMDKLSTLDRIKPLSERLKFEDRAAPESFILFYSGGTLGTMSFQEMMRW